MGRLRWIVSYLCLAVLLPACGAAYQAGTQIRTRHMEQQLKPGMSSVDIRNKWGEPDIRRDVGKTTEIWSYAKHANSNDIAAQVFYTSTKEGDRGTFLDLEFDDGTLQSWHEAVHTMEPKEAGSFGYSIGLPSTSTTGSTHY